MDYDVGRQFAHRGEVMPQRGLNDKLLLDARGANVTVQEVHCRLGNDRGKLTRFGHTYPLLESLETARAIFNLLKYLLPRRSRVQPDVRNDARASLVIQE